MVAFQADEVDATAHSGWSVVVTGTVMMVTDPAEHERLARTGPRPWAPWPDPVFVRIEPEPVTGRELIGGRTLYGVDLRFPAAPPDVRGPNPFVSYHVIYTVVLITLAAGEPAPAGVWARPGRGCGSSAETVGA